jgi:hypothetical protein
MPYTTPTASEFKTRYPAFDSVDSGIVDASIAEANRFVDTGWFEDDYQPAIMALAAHIMLCDGELGGNVDNSGVITSEKLGDASVTYGASVGNSSSEYSQTAYGRKFLRMQRANVAPVALI